MLQIVVISLHHHTVRCLTPVVAQLTWKSQRLRATTDITCRTTGTAPVTLMVTGVGYHHSALLEVYTVIKIFRHDLE